MAPSSLKGYRVHRPVPVMRNAGTAYAERRYQLGAVLKTGAELVVLKNNKPWVIIRPADSAAADRRSRPEKLRALTGRIEADAANEPEWDSAVSDRELLGEERMRRFG